MSQATDLMGLGVPPFMARVLAAGPVTATAFGTSVGSANQIGGQQYFTLCLTGTSSFALPQVGGDTGCLLGDEFVVANMTAASIKVYIANNASGSVVTVYGGAASTAGTTGVTVGAGLVLTARPVTVSTWIGGIASV